MAHQSSQTWSQTVAPFWHSAARMLPAMGQSCDVMQHGVRTAVHTGYEVHTGNFRMLHAVGSLHKDPLSGAVVLAFD
jgi:hypothetical protein